MANTSPEVFRIKFNLKKKNYELAIRLLLLIFLYLSNFKNLGRNMELGPGGPAPYSERGKQYQRRGRRS